MGKKKNPAPEAGAAVTQETMPVVQEGGPVEQKAAAVQEASTQVTPLDLVESTAPEGTNPVERVQIQVPAAWAAYAEFCVAVDAERGLNLRVGPGPGFDALCVLPHETEVVILGLPYSVEVPGWALVRCESTLGWVDHRFLRDAEE